MDDHDAITVTKVPDGQRMDFYPKHFGVRYMARGEGLVFAWARRLLRGYSGGHWSFFELSNGGFFMVLDGAEPLVVSSPNGFEQLMSREAASLVVMLYALNQLANETEFDPLIEKYHALYDFAVPLHPDGGLIKRASN